MSAQHKQAEAEGWLWIAEIGDEDDFPAWRNLARSALEAGIAPDRIDWRTSSSTPAMDFGSERLQPRENLSPFSLPRELLRDLRTALLHRNATRFDLGYRLIWRHAREPGFHANPADRDMAELRDMAKSVRRDIHKMHAFVRFRKVGEAEGREQFAAWFEPDHHIGRATAGFFRNRFTGMNWLIVTPEVSVRWNGKQLAYGPGGNRHDVPSADAVEYEWRVYYRSIFNPARVKLDAMRAEMPVKYWKNLPEASLIAPLSRQASTRVSQMIGSAHEPSLDLVEAQDTTAPSLPAFTDLDELNSFGAANDRPPSPSFSQNIVFGEGQGDAAVMFVGEQPGDREDEAGRVFIGPAGQKLDEALTAAELDRSALYLTNAVKRFKFVQRGKRRIHQSPNSDEIRHYRWWLKSEIDIVRPKLIVCLGATAIEAVIGKKLPVNRLRGELHAPDSGPKLLVTVHPSYLLRLPDESGRAIEFEKFVRDLKRAAAFDTPA